MNKLKKHYYLFIILITAVGCSQLSLNLNTPEKKYLSARSELNILLEEYLTIQHNIKDIDHEIIKASFILADQALDTWQTHITDNNYDYSRNLKTWLDAKSEIIRILRRH